MIKPYLAGIAVLFLLTTGCKIGKQSDPIRITSTPEIEATPNTHYTYTVTTAGSSSFYKLKGPEGMVVGEKTGRINWLPPDGSDFRVPLEIGIHQDQEEIIHKFTIYVKGRTIAGWPTSLPSHEGISAQTLAEMTQFLYTQANKIHGIVIVKNGKLVFEEYFSGYTNNWPDSEVRFIQFTRQHTHFQASVTKTLVSILMGNAIYRGLIPSIQQLMAHHFPDYQPFQNNSDAKNKVTLEHLITMSSGYTLGDEDWQNFVSRIFPLNNWVRGALDLPLAWKPGTTWNYFTPGAHLLGAVIANASNMSLDDFAQYNLFAPMKIEGVSWVFSPAGRAFGGGCHKMRPIDMVKLGFLMINDGLWQGRQIFSKEWIKASVKIRYLPHDGYGYLWWIPSIKTGRGEYVVFMAAGGGGQRIYAVPDLNMVIAITAGYYQSGENGTAFINNLLKNYILP